MSVIQGRCLCGDVTFSCDDDFQQFHLCHCHQCQKLTGSAHVANLFTRPDNITWHSGQAHVTRYNIPGRLSSNAFCPTCGSRLPYLSQTGKALVVPAGCLDDAPTLQPQDHIFWAERAAWYDEAVDAPHFEGLPER